VDRLTRPGTARRAGIVAIALVVALVPAPPGASAAHGQPAYLDAHQPAERRVDDLLSRMTLAEKIGQMTQAERAAVTGDPTLVAQWNLGSVLSGGGSTPTPNTPAAWVQMVNTFQAQALSTRLHIPMIYGIDAVHGHGNVLGATVFPHNVGLGSTRDPGLVERVGAANAAEVRATGIPWSFSPCLCVSRDERWGRAYESFSEDPALVVKMATVVDGQQGSRGSIPADRVLSTAKHYAGDGDTEYDSATAAANVGKPWWEQRYTIDQGITVTSHADFNRIDLAPFRAAVDRGIGTVMPSFSSVDWTADGVGNPVKMHAQQELITGTLKHGMDFDGFVISDWEGIHQIPDPSDPTNGGLTAYKVRTGVNAGIDMFMEPNSAPQFEQLLTDEITAGRVSMARIDDAVRRILREKFRLGLFEHPYAGDANLGQVGSAAHKALARQAVAESQVLLKNSGHALPLSDKAKIYVAGRNADNVGDQSGGWTISWQGETGNTTVDGTSILQGIREVAPHAQITYSADASAPTAGSDVGVVIVGETPYAEGYGDVGGPECGWCSAPQQEEKSLNLQAADKAVVDSVCSAIRTCVVLVVSGRPQIVSGISGESDAIVASWLPGSEGAGVADVLFGKRPFTGRLSVTWPASADQVPINVGDANYRPAYPYGWGLRTAVGHHSAASMKGLESQLKHSANRDDILAFVHDLAQQSVVAGRAPDDWAKRIANAEHAQVSGDYLTAFRLLVSVI